MNALTTLLTIVLSITTQAHAPRPDACRTYNFGGYDATDGVMCSDGITITEHEEQESAVVVTIEAPAVTPEETTVEPEQPTEQPKVKNNNGHGNNEDGVDCSNPGKSKKGQDTDPNVDDEKKNKS